MGEFDDLAAARAEIARFLVPQYDSIESFHYQHEVFAIQSNEQPQLPSKDRPLRRLTTTYTCLEALVEAPLSAAQRRHVEEVAAGYTKVALSHLDNWQSEGSAWVYCRARSLGALVRHFPLTFGNEPAKEAVRTLLDEVWSSTDPDSAYGAYGIRERTFRFGEEPPEPNDPERLYPANAYLTYWATFVSRRLSTSGWFADTPEVSRREKSATDWLTQSLSEQVAYRRARSRHTDPQQLAWSILGVILSSTEADLVRSSRMHDLVAQGLRTFFEEQSKRGDWSRGKPLFNYQYAGNAYCYTYETLAEMLAVATDPDIPAHEGFARLLRPYWRHLYKAFTYAQSTAIPLDGANALGWNSGNHTHRINPESWATASVFRFVQRFRLLIGSWTSQVAEQELGARPARFGIEMLGDRGGSWNMGFGSTGQQLSTFYVQPLLASRDSADRYKDPDETVITEYSGRSAILFGPPGTGKTTLVEAIAGALDWPFIEVVPAQFLDDGFDKVSARADEIFRRMMELDRCVVLLDEIDELVQVRDGQTDALERFFTTTMLPRLAKLWSKGRVMFFANTNNVLGVDSAIRRGQRFDAAILVMPPGAIAKREHLASRGVDVIPDLFERAAGMINGEDPAGELAWLGLLRHDQMDALAVALKDGPVTEKRLQKAVGELGSELLGQDWSGRTIQEVIGNLTELARAQRRDRKLQPVIRTMGKDASAEYKTITLGASTDPDVWARSNNVSLNPDGSVTAIETRSKRAE